MALASGSSLAQLLSGPPRGNEGNDPLHTPSRGASISFFNCSRGHRLQERPEQGTDWWRIFSAPINNLHIFTETGNDAAQAPNYRSVSSKFSTSSDVAICLGCCC